MAPCAGTYHTPYTRLPLIPPTQLSALSHRGYHRYPRYPSPYPVCAGPAAGPPAAFCRPLSR